MTAYDGKKIGNETSVLIFYCSSLRGGSTELFSDEEIWTSHVGLEETVLFIYWMGSSVGEDSNNRYPYENRVDDGK